MWTQRIGLGCLFLMACFRDGEHDHFDDHRHDPPISVAGSPSRPSTPKPQGDFCQQWASAACTDAVVSACQASDAGECQQTQVEFCRSLAPADLSNGSRDACISAVAAAYRDADLRGDELALVLRFGGACARLNIGSSRAGEECDQSSECDLARGFSCVKKADAGRGTCQLAQVIEPGRDCEAAAKTCSEGFFCDGHNCIETLKSGAACAIHEQCGDAGFCSSAGQCEARHKVNDACSSDLECANGICADFDGEKVCTDRVVLSRADPVCAHLR